MTEQKRQELPWTFSLFGSWSLCRPAVGSQTVSWQDLQHV
jgi:hypothetical protein